MSTGIAPIRRIRVKDAVEHVWWLSKTPWPKANNRAGLRPYSPDMARFNPARFPAALPEFLIKLLTDEGDIVVDPFAGSNTTGAVAERLERRWVAVERVEEYLRESRFRFA